MRKMSEHQELISVIIPVYNVEQYLARCMESVINQTYKNLEIILVNDGSTDNSGKMCDEYAGKDSRIKVIHKENGGASTARNVGLSIAQGEYIGFVDSDDWIERDMYEYLLRILHDTSSDISACYFDRVGSMKEQKRIVLSSEDLKVLRHGEIEPFFYRLNGEPSFYAVWNCLFKKSIALRTRFLEGKITEDLYYIFQTYNYAEKIVVSNMIKYHYFVNPFGVTRSRLSVKDFDLLNIWDKIIEETKQTEYGKYARLNKKRSIFTLCTKCFLYGSDIDTEQLGDLKKQLEESYSLLVRSSILDVKRKVLLSIIYIFIKLKLF